MESNLVKFSKLFYDLNVTISGLFCLGLMDGSDYHAAKKLEEMLEDEEVEELNALFGFEEGYLDNDVIDFSIILDDLNGWLVQAEVMHPRNITFSSTGKVEGYTSGGIFSPIKVYNATLEGALAAIVSKATNERERIISKARKEQGMPLVASESEV